MQQLIPTYQKNEQLQGLKNDMMVIKFRCVTSP